MSKIPLLSDILFYIINKFLLEGDKFMHETHLKQSGFTYNTCIPFTKKAKAEDKNSKQPEPPGIFIDVN